jgi:hypothetical protein
MRHFRQYIVLLVWSLVPVVSLAQTGLDPYLARNHYAFSLDSGFDARTRDTLRVRLQAYRLVLQAEGGSHDLDIYIRLPMVWLPFLHQDFGLTHFFFESGHGLTVLGRAYLRTGDTSLLLLRYKQFWKDLYAYDHSRPDERLVEPGAGVDFERPRFFLAALKLLWNCTGKPVPEVLLPSAQWILTDTSTDCDSLLALSGFLKKALSRFEPQFRQYLGPSFEDFVDMVDNPGSCHDVYRNRNGHMAGRLMAFAAGEKMVYGEFGEAHTILHSKGSLGHLINKTPGWEGKVATVNLYCYRCVTDEPVSNWPLHDIERDILQHFIPFCATPFTLFDLTGEDPALAAFKAYGPFLIIARDQH